jgi:CO/xanthine dehydrogenase FAD-binding subunit
MNEPVQKYFFPPDIIEALNLLAEYGTAGSITAGGTAIAGIYKKSGSIPDIIIDLKKCGLNKIYKEKNELVIGSTASITQMIENPLLNIFGNGLFMDILPHIASTPLRNIITLGGNIIKVFPWSDLPLLCMLLDPKVNYAYFDNNGFVEYSSVSYSELITQTPVKFFGTSKIACSVSFEEFCPDTCASALKFSRTGFDYSISSTAVKFRIDDQRIVDPVVVAGACISRPERVEKAENMLHFSRPHKEIFIKASDMGVRTMKFSRGANNISGAYKKDLTASLIKECLEKAFERFKAGKKHDY